MAKPKKADFDTEAEFLERVREHLFFYGPESNQVKDLLAAAEGDAVWKHDAEEMVRQRKEIIGMIPQRVDSGGTQTDQGALLAVFRMASRFIKPTVTSMRIQGILIGLVGSLGGVLGVQQLTPKPPPPQGTNVVVVNPTDTKKDDKSGAAIPAEVTKAVEKAADAKSQVDAAVKEAQQAINTKRTEFDAAMNLAKTAIDDSQRTTTTKASEATAARIESKTFADAAKASADAAKASADTAKAEVAKVKEAVETALKGDPFKDALKAGVPEVIDSPAALGKFKAKTADLVDMDAVFKAVVKKFEESKADAKKVVDSANK